MMITGSMNIYSIVLLQLTLLNTLHDFGEIQEVKLPQDKDEKLDTVKEKEEDSEENQTENAASFRKYDEAVARYGLSLKVVSIELVHSFYFFYILYLLQSVIFNVICLNNIICCF